MEGLGDTRSAKLGGAPASNWRDAFARNAIGLDADVAT
jgi:hypothetical protein